MQYNYVCVIYVHANALLVFTDMNSEDLEETPDYFTVEDDDFGLSSLLVFKNTAAFLAGSDCYHGHKSRNSITLHATVTKLYACK